MVRLISLLLLLGWITTAAQTEDAYYTVVGRVVDERGRPSPDGGICLEPVVYESKAFDRHIECVGNSEDGRFTIKKLKNDSTSGKEHFLFVYLDTSHDSLSPVMPPFDGLRSVDKSFNGVPITLGTKTHVDLGDVPIKFFYGKTQIQIPENLKNVIDWSEIQVKISTKTNFVTNLRTLSNFTIREYVQTKPPALNISLPVGDWKVELIDEKTGRKLAESGLFKINAVENDAVIMQRSSP